jgi:hypothetical protein
MVKKLSFIGVFIICSMMNQINGKTNKINENDEIQADAIERDILFKPEEVNSTFEIQSNDNFFIKSVKKKDARSKKTQFELNNNQEDAYNEIMNKIMENQFLAMKIPPSLNNNVEQYEDSVLTSVQLKGTTISQITSISVPAEIEALKLSDTTTPTETSGIIIQLY